MASLRRFMLPWLALLPLLLIGCGSSGPKVVKVSGTLTYKGNPVPGVQLDFTPKDGQRPSWGETDEQGRFTLEYDDRNKGAVTGTHKVSVRLKLQTTKEREAEMLGKPLPVSKERAALAAKYGAEKSTVEVTIDKPTSDLKLAWD